MAKFGLFNSDGVFAVQEYEGDFMSQNGQYVTIYKTNPNPHNSDIQVAAIHLDKGQSVKKLG